jgi:hypothetical protein
MPGVDEQINIIPCVDIIDGMQQLFDPDKKTYDRWILIETLVTRFRTEYPVRLTVDTGPCVRIYVENPHKRDPDSGSTEIFFMEYQELIKVVKALKNLDLDKLDSAIQSYKDK